MAPQLQDISWRGWLKVGRWTVFGTLGCVVISVAYNWIAFRGFDPGAIRQGLLSALVLPIILAGPLFFYLTLKLRELSIANHKLNELASIDSLTGCLNRRAFTRLVEEHLANADEAGGALLVVDVDHFKSVNDEFGHEQGDFALKQIAGAISSTLRISDLVGRLGGEEFGVFLPDATASNAGEAAERIRAAVGSIPLEMSRGGRRLSVSVGCAIYARATEFSELFRIADHHLYAAKKRGRDRVEIASVPALTPSFDDLALAK